MKNDFVSNVTHELRSPLSAIESYANLVTDDWRSGRSQNLVDYITIVRNNATRLRKFVTDILDLSKIDAGTLEIEKERFSVVELVGTRGPFSANAREKNVRLSMEIPSEVTVFADMDKVRQILTNLLGNALKFTPAGGQVAISAEAAVLKGEGKNRFTRLTVADTGPGIPEKDQQRIFDRFEQVKEMRESIEGQKGTGLGLAIVRQLVKAHGGQIGLESVVGRGSAFAIYFPEGETDAPAKRILVVDDEPDFVRFMEDILKREGFVVSVTGNGLQALKMVAESRPDAILLDWNLPGKDGIEVCRTESIASTKTIPVLMLTVRGRETDAVLGLEMGADDYITKRVRSKGTGGPGSMPHYEKVPRWRTRARSSGQANSFWTWNGDW